jgi:hypothetical protein
LRGRPEIGDPDAVAEYLRDFHKAFVDAASTHVTDERVLAQMRRIGWLLSSVERNKVEVRLYHSDYDFQPMEYSEKRPCSLLPSDMTVEQSSPAEHELMAALRVCRSARDVDVTVEENLKVMARYFDRQKEVSAVLGTGIQVGYHTLAGEIEVTEIMPLADFR